MGCETYFCANYHKLISQFLLAKQCLQKVNSCFNILSDVIISVNDKIETDIPLDKTQFFL